MTPRFVLAHGFTQTGRSWATTQTALTARIPGAEFLAVDLPGHGTAANVRADLWGSADYLTAMGRRGIYVGYSMGGRVALHCAYRGDEAVVGLVLIGATAGIDDVDERARRRATDEELARRLERVGVAAFVDEWLTNPLFAHLGPEAAMRSDRLRNAVPGLAASLRMAGTGTQMPLWDRLDRITVPTLVLAGEHDAKFRALGERLASGIPSARLDVIPDAGHSVHLEQPDATASAIANWLPPEAVSDTASPFG